MNIPDGDGSLKSREENIAPTSGTPGGPTPLQQVADQKDVKSDWGCVRLKLLTRHFKTILATVLKWLKRAVLKTARP